MACHRPVTVRAKAGSSGGASTLVLSFCIFLASSAAGGMKTNLEAAATRDAGPGRPAIEVRARAIAPGEAIRIIVRCARPLAEIHATFLGEEVFLSSEDVSAGTGSTRARSIVPESVWSGWAAIPLDRKPGKERISVQGRTESGLETASSLEVRIRSKSFPEQKLTVEEKFVTPPPEVEARIESETKRLAAVYAMRRSASIPEVPFVRPVPGDPTGTFGSRRILNGKPRAPHPGLDLRAATGTLVRASGGGLVAVATDLYYSGSTVILDHGGGLFTIYAHLSEIQVKEGEMAQAGQVVGLSGATGRVTGPHLHWGAKIGDRAFDPTSLLSPALFLR